MSTVSGTVYLRPVRLGFVAAKPSRDVLLEAVHLASGVWGGIYFPIFEADDPELLRRANALALDVLHPLDEVPKTTEVTDAPGFRWRGGAEWGPFGGSEDLTVREGLLPIDRLVDSGAADGWRLCWTDDALGALYDVWFGASAPAAEPPLASPPFSEVATDGDLFASSPIAKTRHAIEYRGTDVALVVVVVNHKRDADLLRLWNLRAAGGLVHPWVIGYDQENALALRDWLNDSSLVAGFPRAKRGDGTDLGPVVHISAGIHQSDAEAAHNAVGQLGFRAVRGTGVRGGWWGHHPLGTKTERAFNMEVPKDAWHLDVALPSLPLIGETSHWPGTVAADIVVHRESESAAGRTLSLPAVRRLALSIEHFTRDVERLHRPTGEGRVVGVQATASAVTVALVPTVEVFERLLPEDAAVGQSDDGRFATQFVDRLGGPNSAAASQPAVRQVLYDLSNADRSSPIAKLIRAALGARGAWPDFMSRRSPAEYATSVVYGLADTGLVVPTVSVRCPSCATETDVRPDDLAAEMRCAVCRSELNLGLALALQGTHNPWRYRLAAHLPPGRIRSGLAAMAANAVLRSAHRAGSAPAMPHVFGMTVRLKTWSCEIDVAALILDGPLTLAVVGEVKGGREQIEATDIENLQRVQEMLRSAGVETFVLAGTTRNRLDAAEVAILRAACESAPDRLMRHHHGLVLPIVLCGAEMSMPWFDEDHPWRWGTPGGLPLGGLAERSCQRNLGLQEGDPTWRPDDDGWNLNWTTPAGD
jgi:hypothetical protein